MSNFLNIQILFIYLHCLLRLILFLPFSMPCNVLFKVGHIALSKRNWVYSKRNWVLVWVFMIIVLAVVLWLMLAVITCFRGFNVPLLPSFFSRWWFWVSLDTLPEKKLVSWFSFFYNNNILLGVVVRCGEWKCSIIIIKFRVDLHLWVVNLTYCCTIFASKVKQEG